MTTRRRIERGHESVPALGIEHEHPPIRESLLGLAEGRVEHELTDGLALGGCSRLQGLFCGPGQPKIELFRPVAALGHFASYAEGYHNPPDNVTTNRLRCPQGACCSPHPSPPQPSPARGGGSERRRDYGPGGGRKTTSCLAESATTSGGDCSFML